VAIDIKGEAELEKMRESCIMAAACLRMSGTHVKAGVTTGYLDKLCHEYILDHGGIPAPLNYHGFPRSICTSIDEVVCHGIPDDKRALREGEIINVDVTTILHGYHGDTSATYYVGEVSPEARLVTETAREGLQLGIDTVAPRARIRDIGGAIEDHAHGKNCSVVRDYCGHGIGREFHTEPQVPHYRFEGRNPRMRAGMTFTIEPMINLGTWKVELLSDGWTVKTRDRALSAQFEHTILVTEGGHDVLTHPDKIDGSKWDV
jgi:methionyl aminopeptidase